jgi:hypothetical protein
MKLTREKVLNAVVNALREAQQNVVGELEQINERTRPIGDLRDFDSLTSVMVTVHCLVTLGIEDIPSSPSLFITKRGDALTVGEVADRIIKEIDNE